MPRNFASTGVVVGQTKRNRREQKNDNSSGVSVTMGKGVPRQNEGKVGDITVREITTVGLRTYIKTNAGWIDINAMTANFEPNWKDMHLLNSWATDDTYGAPQYMKDAHGFVHLRGGVDTGSHASIITTLPVKYRPTYEQRRLTIRALDVGLLVQQIRITTNGEINKPYAIEINIGGAGDDFVDVDNTAEVTFDGISFFAGKDMGSIMGGGEFETSNIGTGIVL